MTTTRIDVAAQFGGDDAAQLVLPHFRALKAALRGIAFDGFPIPELAFILRVDGSVSAYGLSGAGNVEFDRKGRYVSIDIGITNADLEGGGDAELAEFIAESIRSSPGLLKNLGDQKLRGVDWSAVAAALESFANAYRAKFTH